MTTTTHTTTGHRTLGESSALYATELVIAVLDAGAPGTVRRLTHAGGSTEANAGPHARWSFTRTHLCAHPHHHRPRPRRHHRSPPDPQEVADTFD